MNIEQQRAVFTKVAEIEYRNDERFTQRDFDLCFRAWKLGQTAKPVSEQLRWPEYTCIRIEKVNMGDRWDASCHGFAMVGDSNKSFIRQSPHAALDAILEAMGEDRRLHARVCPNFESCYSAMHCKFGCADKAAQQDVEKVKKVNPTKGSPLTALQMTTVIALRDANEVDARPETEQGETALFPIGILGHPMREFESGKWESARWPSDQARADQAMAARDDIVSELQHAHQIIRNALAIMTTDQKCRWAELNARDGCDGEGTTRANERAAAIDVAMLKGK